MAAVRKRHLVVDARAVRAVPSGVGIAILRQIKGLDAILARRDDWRVTVIRLASQLDDPSFRATWEALPHLAMVDTWADPAAHPAGDLWQQLTLPGLLERLGTDVLYSPAFTGPLRAARFARLLMIHDDLVWSQPRSYPWKFRVYLRLMASLSARTSTRVLFPSDDARRRVLQRLSLADARTGVVLHGVDSDVYRPAPLAGRERFALCIASGERRKNHEVLLQAFAKLGIRLVLVGLSGSAARSRQVGKHGKDVELEIVPSLPEPELVGLLRRAAVLLSPSLGEGFGMPVLEAMACGTPVIASRIGVLEEVAGGAALYADPHNPAEWRDAVRSVLAGGEAVEERREAGLRRAAELTPAANATELLHQCELALHGSRRYQEIPANRRRVPDSSDSRR